MSEEKGYQGSANYETWAVGLWLDKDESAYQQIMELVREHKDEEIYKVGDLIKDWVWEWIGEGEPGLREDFVNASMGEVDWYELAENYLEEVKDED